jgi:hypothetical protein
MRISIETQPIGPLHVIPTLPDARLAVLEGLNGIGKSLAIRLLQACTGQLPYQSDSAAWRSLCKGLGPFRVSVSNLVDGHEITWVGDSRSWQRDTDRPGPNLYFERIQIDGEAKSLDEARALLVVHRVAGDEDILSTFAQQAQINAATVGRWAAQTSAQNQTPLAGLETAIDDTISQLGEWTLPRLRQVLDADNDARSRLTAARTKAVETQARLKSLRRALEVYEQLHDLRERAPGVEQQLVDVDQEINNVSQKRDRILSQVAEISAKVVIAEPRKQDLHNAQRTLTRNRNKLSQELATASAAAQPLGVRPEEPEIERVISEAQSERDMLTAQLAEMDASPVVRDVLGGITATLASAEERGLGDQVAVDDSETGIQLTIMQTRRGMSARRRFLEEQVPAPEMQTLAEKIGRLKRVISDANDVLTRLGSVRRYERLVSANEARAADALAATNPGAADALRQLESDRKGCDDELMQLAARRAALGQQLGSVASGTTVAALEAQLREALTDAAVDEATLNAEFSLAENVNSVAQADLRDRQESVSLVRRELGRAETEIRAVTATISEAHDLSWLRATLGPGQIPRETEDMGAQVHSLDEIRRRLAAVLERLGAFRVQLAAVEEALQSISKVLRKQPPDASLYVPELQRWLGSAFSQWFNDERVRSELLPAATSAISVDVSKAEVSWSEGSQSRSRPLEAFSSGEQAFAYTRARLAVLDDEEPRPANRLIVLDEFGSFIAHDRLSGLLAYLSDRSVEHEGDQMLVILPLSQDYTSQAANAVGEEAERLRRWALDIATRGYLVRALPT